MQARLGQTDALPAGAIGASAADVGLADRSIDLTTRAYERIEELFVAMRLSPGSYLRTQDLQAMVGLGRTPVHQAVRRLAAETLIEVRPRNGLRIAPIDLSRERHLSILRRDLNRFVTEAAIRNMNANDRSRLVYLRRRLASEAATLTVDDFNAIDKALDNLLIQASGERFLERALRPLHAIARRIGYLHLTQISGQKGLDTTIARHLDIMDSILQKDEATARQASDDLVTFSIGLIDELAETIDPRFLDTSFDAPGRDVSRVTTHSADAQEPANQSSRQAR